MPSPSSTTFQRPDLGQSFEEFDVVAEREGYIGLRALKPFPSAVKTGNFSVIPVEQLLEDAKLDRAPGSGYSRGKYQFEQASFDCVEYGHEEPLDDSERAMYAYTIDAERVTTDRGLMKVLRGAEKRACDLLLATSASTGTAGIWSTASSGTPITDAIVAKLAIRNSTGLRANAGIMDWEAFVRARECAEVLDRIKYSGIDDPKDVTPNILAQAMGLEELIISGGMRNSAKTGQAATFTQIWTKTVFWVGRIARSMDLREPCFGRAVLWTGDGGGSMGDGAVAPAIVEQYRDEPVRSDIFRVRHWMDELTLYNAAGYKITGVL